MTTVWTKGPGRVPLYSDWKVCFTTTTTTTTKTATTSSGSSSSSSRTSAIRSGKDYQDTDSVSTSTTSPSSTGEEDSAVHSDSIHENENENENESEQHEEVQEEGQEVVHTDSIHNENENDAKLEDEVSEEEQQEGETKVAYFYVHRNMIGPKSEFFTKSFLSRTNGSGNNNNNNNNTTSESVVSLPADLPTHYFNSVVEAFEILLEYCYQIQRPSNSNSIGGGSSSGRLFDLSERLTTSNVVALFCLCQSFGMDSGITEQVRSVLDTDLTPDTVAQYYQIVKDLRSNAEEQHQHQHQHQHQQVSESESESVSMQPPPPPPPLKEKTVGGDPSSSGSSITLDAGPIMDRIIALCRKHPSVLRPDSDLPKIADLPLWLALGKLLTLNNNNNNNSNDEDSGDNLEATRNNNNNNNEEEKEAEAEAEAEENNSKIWSENIAHFFDTCEQRGVLMQEYFREPFRVLTAECVLPEVSETVALRLLEYEHKQGLDDIIVVVGDDDDDDDDDPTVSSDNEDSQNQNNNNNNNRYESDLEPREDDNGDEDDNEEQKEEDLTPAATATATAAAQKMDRSHSNNNNNNNNAGRLTNLQQRCIKALGESNWAGPENELEGRTGTLTEITTPVVLEQLLIRSATRERALVTRCKDLEATLRAERELQAEKDEKLEFFNKEKDFAIAREVGKQLSLQNSLEKEKEKRKAAEEKLEKLVTATKVLCKANASLQAELEAEQTESNNLSRRVRTLEITRRKTESDREMFELSVKETIKRLENIVHPDDWGTPCGGLLGALTMMMSSENDHVECARIKSMLQQVVQDPMAYERNFLNQGCGDADTYTMAASKSNEDATFNTTSNIGDFDDCSIATEPKA